MTTSAVPFYNFADVLLASSSDGGNTWTPPARVNQDPITNQVDQFFPALAVDNSGQVGVLFYDRRNDPANFLMDVFLARSADGGSTWNEWKVTRRSFPVIVAQDSIVTQDYMGDYIGLTADASGAQTNFMAAWGDNSLGRPSVAVRRVPASDSSR